MALVEDLGVFLADFGQACTLAGSPITAIVDTDTLDDPASGAITQAVSAQVLASAAPAAAAGQSFVAAAVTYKVRQVLKEAPDGAYLRLVLARA